MPQTRNLNGPAVRAIRELVGVRARAFAQRVEIDPGYLTKIEQGARQPSADVMRRIAQGLGVALEVVTYPVDHCDTPETHGRRDGTAGGE